MCESKITTKKMFKLLAFLFVCILIMSFQQEIEAVCCVYTRNGRCNDGTHPTPYCAYGACNIFGCNCAGGCR